METMVALFGDFTQHLNDLVGEGQALIESLGAVVSTLTGIAGVMSQAVDFVGSLLTNVSVSM
jgi:hypothetical protein